MAGNRYMVAATPHTLEIFNNLDKSSTNDIKEISLKTDLFCLFYLENPVLKNLEEVPIELWMSYFLLEGLVEHYSLKNIQSFTKDHPVDSYWIAGKIFSEFKTIKEGKKTQNFFVNSNSFLTNSKNMDFDDLIAGKETRQIKKQIKMILSNILVSLNGFLRKIEPLSMLVRGHDIAPLSFQQIDDSQVLQLAEKLQNPKFKELIKTFAHSNIKDSQEDAANGKKDETQSGILLHNIFYINDKTQDKKDIYKNWLIREIKDYRKDK
ncbi:MAG: hypothetical protein ABII25_08590, partial [bacterium]